MRKSHERREEGSGQGAARRPSVQGQVVVSTDPDAARELWGVAREPGVDMVVARTGLARDRPVDDGPAAGAALHDGPQQIVEAGHRVPVDNALLGRCSVVLEEDATVGVLDARD